MASIQGIYLALFGRPADPIGLAYYNDVTKNGADLSAIGNLAGEAEYLSRFDGMNNTQIVTSIYQSLFGRNPDLTGLTFFVNGLNSGEYTINDIAIRILDGATGVDADLVAAKEAAADQFTAAVAADADFLAAYQGDSGIALGQSFINQVNAADVEFTDAEVAAFIKADVDAGTPGNIFTLTDAVGENVVGTAANDEFRAVLDGAGATTGTYNVGDAINGGGGTDTLNLTLTGAAALPGGASVSNVEIINLLSTGGTTLAGLTGGTFAGATQLWQVNAAAAVTGVNATVTAGFRNIAGLAADVSFSAATGNVALDGISAASAVDVTGTGTGSAVLRTVNISGSVEDTLDIVDTAGAGTVRTLNLSLTSEDGVGLVVDDVAALRTLNAADSSAAFTVTLDVLNNADLEAVTLGSGDDVLEFVGYTDEGLTIDLGAGDDVVTLAGTEAGATITLGAGFDEVVFGAIANITTADADDALEEIIEITDFNGAQDFVTTGGLALFTLSNADQNTFNTTLAEDGLVDALDFLAGTAGVNFSFAYEGSTYIYTSAAADFGAGDGLVKLTGFTGAFTAANSDFA